MSPNDLSLTIRPIVREEWLRCQQISHCPSAFRDGYARETARVRTPAAPAPWQPSVNAADVDECQGSLRSLEYSDRTPSNSSNTPVSRPPPVCYSCGVPGHIFCNNAPNTSEMSPQPFDRSFSTPPITRHLHYPPFLLLLGPG
ncbi:hypothetical protein HPB49_007823 [Dermacentor silvarum]|uniref:Uncharacterized protein n=1 Tax=Dermacentor silvarum TaxID=543639 RepID=A0ACB8CW17_DERSI|nr:hypothetical protein HPB49_007823 [Dermacentor silvarum]